LRGVLFLQDTRVDKYGAEAAGEWPHHLTPQEMRQKYRDEQDEFAKGLLSISSPEDSWDDESPNQPSRLKHKERPTPLSSKKGVVLQNAFASLKQEPVLAKLPSLKDPRHTLLRRTRRAERAGNETVVGAGRGQKRSAPVGNVVQSLARKRRFSEMDGSEVVVVNDGAVTESVEGPRRRSRRLKLTDGRDLCVSTTATTKRASKPLQKSTRVEIFQQSKTAKSDTKIDKNKKRRRGDDEEEMPPEPQPKSTRRGDDGKSAVLDTMSGKLRRSKRLANLKGKAPLQTVV
jgi:hypothetical protein